MKFMKYNNNPKPVEILIVDGGADENQNHIKNKCLYYNYWRVIDKINLLESNNEIGCDNFLIARYPR